MPQPFHAYVDGNIGWEPAFEVEAASDAVALRVWKEETTLQPAIAQARLRGSILAAIKARSLGILHSLPHITQRTCVRVSTGQAPGFLWPAPQGRPTPRYISKVRRMDTIRS